MACLLVTGEVLCVWSGGVSKIRWTIPTSLYFVFNFPWLVSPPPKIPLRDICLPTPANGQGSNNQ